MNSKPSASCFTLHHALVFVTDNECVYCAVRTGFGNTLISQSNLSLLICCAKSQALWRRRLPASARVPSIWDLWWTKCYWDSFFSEYLGFSLSLSFHQCSILIFVCMLLLLEKQTGEAWGSSKKQRSFWNRGVLERRLSLPHFCSI